MTTFALIFFGLLGLTLIVTIHEYGHFLAARWAGVEVEAFAIGWGKVLWSWKPGKTEYRLCLLPLGGYCKMKGEQDLAKALESDVPVEPEAGSLFGAPAWKRIVISAAGPVFNLVFAFLVFFGLQLTGVPETSPEARVLLASEVDGRTGLPADQAGLQSGDLVRTINGTPVQSFTDLQRAVAGAGGRATPWVVDRQGASVTLTVTPQYDEKEKRSLVGVYPYIVPLVKAVKAGSIAGLAGVQPGDQIVAVAGHPVRTTQEVFQAWSQVGARSLAVTVSRSGETKELSWIPEASETLGLEFNLPTWPAQGLAFVPALAQGWAKTTGLLGQMVDGLAQLFTGKANPGDSLSGPLRISYYVGEGVLQGFEAGWGQGWGSVGQLLSLVSLALFLMNLLPIPALDGGSIVVSVIEGVRRRRLSARSLMRYQMVGVTLIFALVIFTTFNDGGFLLNLGKTN